MTRALHLLLCCSAVSPAIGFVSSSKTNNNRSSVKSTTRLESTYDDDGEDLSDLLVPQPQRRRQRSQSLSPQSGMGLKFSDGLDDLTDQLALEIAMNSPSREEVQKIRTAPEVDGGVKTEQNRVPVKFINFDSSNPYDYRTAVVEQGTNLMKLADEIGVAIPRNCKNGICGSCMADLIDPTWQDNTSTHGRQTIRLCSTGAVLPADCDEMVIDCYRNNVVSTPREKLDTPRVADVSTVGDGRFNEDWETEFQPEWAARASKVTEKQTQVRDRVSPTGKLDLGVAQEEELAIELSRVAKNMQKARGIGKTQRFPIAGSSIFQAGRMYTWYNRGVRKRRRKYKVDKHNWTFHDVERSLGGVFEPGVADGIAPWDRIW